MNKIAEGIFTPAEQAVANLDRNLGTKPLACECGEGGGWNAAHSKWCPKFQAFKIPPIASPPTYETFSDSAPKGILKGDLLNWMGTTYMLGDSGFVALVATRVRAHYEKNWNIVAADYDYD